MLFLIFSFLVLLFIIYSVCIMFCVAVVSGNSMDPTFEEGDLVIALRHVPASLLRKGQVVIVSPNLLASRHTKQTPDLYIKRTLALPGETVTKHLSELNHYYRANLRCMHDEKGQRTWAIPQGHIFVQGDRLPRGYDSLTWGPIPQESVIGIVLAKFWTRDRILPQIIRRTSDFN